MQGGKVMEAIKFDRVARSAGALKSRRGLLGLVSGMTLGGLLTDREEGAARRKHGGHRPGKKKDNRKGKRNQGNKGGNLGAGADPLLAAGCVQGVGFGAFDVPVYCPPQANLAGADLSTLDNLSGNLREANLSGSKLPSLSDLDLSGANLAQATFGASFTSVVLDNAFLAEANLTNVTLIDVSLKNAVLVGANLQGFTLEAGSFDVTGAVWDRATCPDGTKLTIPGQTCCLHFVGPVPTGC
jgi:hypothetical protein